MKKGYIKLIFIEMILLFSTFFNKLIYTSNILTILFLLLVLVASIFLIGFEKDKHLNRVDVIQKVTIYSFYYYVFTYFIGLFSGFLKNSYNLSLLSIVKNVIPYLCIFVLIELIRYVIVSKANRNKFIIIFCSVLFAFIDFILNHGNYNFNTFSSTLRLISLYFIPSLSKSFFLTYLCGNFGYKPCLVYRMCMELLIFILPIFPALGDYVRSILLLLIPIMFYFALNRTIINKRKKLLNDNRWLFFNRLIFYGCTVILVYFTSGIFKYYALAIGSASMSPNIEIGDVVIVKKIKSKDLKDLKIGDVLVYKHGNMTIVHRIVAINEKNDWFIINTKGDNNESADGYDIVADDIIGVANVKISYVGLPVVWLNKTFK